MIETVILVAALAAAGASDASQCATMADDAERLACYDALHRGMEQAAAEGKRPAEGVPPTAEATRQAPSAAATTQATTTVPDPTDDFGLTAQQRDERDGAASRVDEIRAVVVEIHKSRAGKPAYTLDNGQRWRQTEATSRPLLKVGATVVIKRAALGSFMAKMPDFSGPPAWVRREE